MANERTIPPKGNPATDAAPSRADTAESVRPSVDRLTIGKLIDHGRARHEFHPNGHPSYFAKVLTDDGPRTFWGKGLETAFRRSRTQPQINDVIGIQENNLDPISFVTRKRNKDGVVIAENKLDTPRPHWVVEKLEDFDLRAAAARALRDPSLSRREAVANHRELAPAYWILDTGKKFAAEKWPNPRTQEAFLAALRETLATTIERGIDLPQVKTQEHTPTLGNTDGPRPPSERSRER